MHLKADELMKATPDELKEGVNHHLETETEFAINYLPKL